MNLCHSVKNGQHHWTEIRSSSEIKNKSQELRKWNHNVNEYSA